MPDSDTVGGLPARVEDPAGDAASADEAADETPARPGPLHFVRSLRLQLNLLVALFLILPLLLYSVFSAVDKDRRGMVLDAIRDNGLLISKALEPMLQSLQPDHFDQLQPELARFGSPDRSIKLLYKPSGSAGGAGFFYVASVPAVTSDHLAEERQRLVDLGVLDRLAQSCNGDTPLSERVAVPDQGTEILTSVSPVESAQGCWAIVVAADAKDAASLVGDGVYWERPAIRIALALYIAMALSALVIFVRVRSGLAGLRRTAQAVDAGDRFERNVSVPEFLPMAREFDHMVARLQGAAALLRQAAEDNAHALKGPLGAIRQSLEPLRDRLADPERIGAAADAMGHALDRLDGLVRSMRRLDTATAELLDSARHDLDLSGLVEGFAADYRRMLGERSGQLAVSATPGIRISGNEDLVEVILENLVDNALSFCPEDGRVQVRLARDEDEAVLTVLDDGPGVEPGRLRQIFDRYFSSRPPSGQGACEHFGIGLWLVQQHALVLGGAVHAENRREGGLMVRVRLPIADKD